MIRIKEKISILKCNVIYLLISIVLLTNFSLADSNIRIKTEVFEEYRNIKIYLPEGAIGSYNAKLKNKDKEEGEFSIQLSNIQKDRYGGDRVILREDEYPIKLVVHFPQKNEMKLSIESDSYNSLESKYIRKDNIYSVKIYYNNINTAIAGIKGNNNGNKEKNIDTAIASGYKSLEGPNKSSTKNSMGNIINVSNLLDKIEKGNIFKIIGTFLSGVIVLSFLTFSTLFVLKIYYGTSWKKLIKTIKGEVETDKGENYDTLKNENVNKNQAENKATSDKDNKVVADIDRKAVSHNKKEESSESSDRIRKIMRKKEISYDEAQLIVKMNG